MEALNSFSIKIDFSLFSLGSLTACGQDISFL
jgi:hypothetical protein